MGAEATLPTTDSNSGEAEVEVEAPLVLGLQAAALVDHVARVDWSLLNQLPGERGGSIPVIPFDFNSFASFVSCHFWSKL